MSAMLEIDNVSTDTRIPLPETFQEWADSAIAVLPPSQKPLHIGIRIVDEEESTRLNSTYRSKNKSTNVLSFPSHLPTDLLAQLPDHPLGDLVICAPVITREAAEQEKKPNYHWAHMVIHGILHLAGYDHQVEEEAEIMESLEIKILSGLNIANPYQTPQVQM